MANPRTMTDFYALLKQSILDRGIRKSGDREEVYAQARRAVVKQLWDFRPPLAADEIDMRVGAYDSAVERIEADLRTVFADEEVRVRAKPAAARAASAGAAAVRTSAHVNGAGRGRSSAALATDWAREQPDYAPGVQRAAPSPVRAVEDDEVEEEALDAEYVEETVIYEEEVEEVEEEPPPHYQQRPRSDRWSQPTALAPLPQPRKPIIPNEWLAWLGTGEQLKIRLLAIAIGTLVIVIVAVGAYMLGAHGRQSVTVDINERREVSDAATASRIPKDNMAVTQSFALFDGRDPTIFMTTPDNPIHFDDANGFVRVSSSTSSPGVKVLVGPGLAARLAGQQVRVVIDARASSDGGAANMRFAYQSGLAISHWQTANLEADYQELGMTWRVPTMRTNPNGDYLLIEPGIPGDGTGADIRSIRIDVLAAT